jgi:predicted AAA+ superfamily ATPase
MVNATSSGIMLNLGRLLENMVFIALRKFSQHIFYYKTKSNCEVDFIVQLADRTRWLIQVCESLDDLKTKEREVKALIEVIAAWQFMLNLEQLFK